MQDVKENLFHVDSFFVPHNVSHAAPSGSKAKKTIKLSPAVRDTNREATNGKVGQSSATITFIITSHIAGHSLMHNENCGKSLFPRYNFNSTKKQVSLHADEPLVNEIELLVTSVSVTSSNEKNRQFKFMRTSLRMSNATSEISHENKTKMIH